MPGAVQLYRGGAVERLATAGDRERCQEFRPDGGSPGAVASLDLAAAAVLARDQPPWRVRRRRCPLRVGQACRLGRRRGGDGGYVCPRVSEGYVRKDGDDG